MKSLKTFLLLVANHGSGKELCCRKGNQSESTFGTTPLAPAVQIQNQPSGCCPQ